ncbi:MAG TPA: hypothetical protein VND93_07050 [Myxococcales bacterium]|nr:hypothetical protein [Myxococcales bacterium]
MRGEVLERSASHRTPVDPGPASLSVGIIRIGAGETLRQVAERHRQSVRTLEVANALPHRAALKAGAKLIVPAGHRAMSRAALMEAHRRDLLDKLAVVRFMGERESTDHVTREVVVTALRVGLRCYSRLFPESMDEGTRGRIEHGIRGLLQPGPLSEVAMDRLYAELTQLPRADDVAALGRWVDAELEARTARLVDAWSYPPAFERLKGDAAANPEFLGLYQLSAGADDYYVAAIESPPRRKGVSARVAYDAAGTLLATGERRFSRGQGKWEPAFTWRPCRSLLQ